MIQAGDVVSPVWTAVTSRAALATPAARRAPLGVETGREQADQPPGQVGVGGQRLSNVGLAEVTPT